jgi:hypothetical protein
MAKVAAETQTVTQMGNQGHAGEGLRLHKEFIDAGAIGTVREVHVWSDRPYSLDPHMIETHPKLQWFWTPGGRLRPKEIDPVPPELDWDLWQGPAPEHPYNHTYPRSNWRCWYDYGNNAIGDMMVHNADPACTRSVSARRRPSKPRLRTARSTRFRSATKSRGPSQPTTNTAQSN